MKIGVRAVAIPRDQPVVAVSPGIEETYVRRARQLWSFGRRLGLDSESAEDVMQEAFARAMRQPPGSIESLDTWLFRVVHNLAVDMGRQADIRRPRFELPAAAQSSDDSVLIWDAVDRLPERQRATVYLRFRADLDFASVASVLGISEGGARANCARALDGLRKLQLSR